MHTVTAFSKHLFFFPIAGFKRKEIKKKKICGKSAILFLDTVNCDPKLPNVVLLPFTVNSYIPRICLRQQQIQPQSITNLAWQKANNDNLKQFSSKTVRNKYGQQQSQHIHTKRRKKMHTCSCMALASYIHCTSVCTQL